MRPELNQAEAEIACDKIHPRYLRYRLILEGDVLCAN